MITQNNFGRLAAIAAWVGCLGVCASSAWATTIAFNSPTSTSYLTAANWTGGVTPGASDIAQFGTNPTSALTMAISLANSLRNDPPDGQIVGAIELSSARTVGLSIGNSSSGFNGQLSLAGTTVNAVNDVVLRNASTGTLTLQNFAGSNTTGTMTVTLDDVTTNIVQIDGTGNIVINTAIANGSGSQLEKAGVGTGALTLAGVNTFTGGVKLTAGTLNINNAAALGTGTLTITGGTTINNSTGANIVSSTNNAQQWNGNFTFTGTRALNLGTGPVTMATNIQLSMPGASATNNALTIAGAISDGGSGFALTKTGTGRLFLASPNSTFSGGVNVQGGTVHVNDQSSDFANGKGPLGIGALTLNGTQLIGSSGTAVNTLENDIVLNPQGSGVNELTTNGTMTLSGVISGSDGFTKDAAGAVILTNANSSYAGTTIIDRGSLIVSANAPSGANGALGNSTGAVLIGDPGATTNPAYLLTGAAVSIGRSVTITANGTGVFGIGGVASVNSSFDGLVTFQRGMTVGQLTAGGILSINGGLAGSSATPVTLTFGDATAPGFFGNVTVNSAISESGGGAVSVLVTGGLVTYATGNTNTYSGTTAVNAGALIVNGTHSGAGAYTVAAGALLGGSGTIATAGNAGVTISGQLSPGNSPGVLSMDLGSGVLDISAAVGAVAAGSMLFDLDTPATSDQVLLTGAASSLNIGSGGLEFDDFVFTPLGGFGPGTYTLLDTSSSIAGTLGSNLSGMIGGYSASIGFANGGQDVVLTVVPEPTAIGLGLAGMSVLLTVARRKRR